MGTILAASGATTISLQDFSLSPSSNCTINVEIIADTDAIGPTPTYAYKVDALHSNTLPVGSITFDAGS